MEEKRSEKPGTETGVPRDLPPPPEEAEREEAIVDLPTAESAGQAPPEAYPEPDEAGSGQRGDDEARVSPAEPVEEETGPQEQPD
ncbi:hypothetical protein [Streptomyces sp. NBC_00286]|uniref:hypothetical protein n=1 Tax=Streptomyces sp. NBC_00286 TaxID=2975701 RepID=UPI002E2D45C0|nr:hypothetical protein [Streptomyces sp. NBC_00286]